MSDAIPVIEISGSPLERGERYGAFAASRIAESIAFYRTAIREWSGLDWADCVSRARHWLPQLEDFAPDLLEEMRGIAAGAGVEFADILVLNLRGEILYDSTFGTLPDPDGCTSFALTAAGDGHVYTGQNWDWRAGTAGTVMVVRVVQPPMPTLLMVVEAGQVMRHGASSAGIALQANGMGGRFDSATVGLPHTVVRRRALEQESIQTALEVVVSSRPHIAGNTLLTDRSGFAIDVEATPGAVGWMYPTDDLLVHGNHYQAFRPPQLAETYRPQSVDSLIRVPRVTEGLRACTRPLDSATIRKTVRTTFSDHLGYPESVCTHPTPTHTPSRQALTLTSSCVDLTTGEYRITGGPPCRNEYQLLPWNIYDGPAGRPSPDTESAES